MDLTMCERDVLGLLAAKVLETHSDHRRLFFFDINELNETLLTASLKVPASAIVGLHASDTVSLLVEHHLNVPLSDLESVVLDDVEWTLYTACVGEEPDFAARKVSHD